MTTPIHAWEKFWGASGASSPAPELLGELLLAWSEPHRHYHTLQHLAECLTQLEQCWALAERPEELCMALVFHDAIYDVHAADNEARSAEWAQRTLHKAGFEADAAQRVYDLILATRHDAAPAQITPDCALLLDIDLAILGARPERFAEYEAQIRAEYAWVAEPAYRSARAKLLADFLARPQIYCSEHFHAHLEDAARRNLNAAVQRLEEAPEHAFTA